MPVSGKGYALAANKRYKTIAIQVDASTTPKSEKAECEKPKTIAVDAHDVIEIHASQSDESLMEDLSPKLSSSAPCEEQVRILDNLLYLLELPWSKNST
ncbi:hypothetical protein TNCV_19461 [Trichonephila clavipes]|nr:hypothetical protein TNCV_19461 [Trichonephila clavipes]